MLFRLLASAWRVVRRRRVRIQQRMRWLRDEGDVAGGPDLADVDPDVFRTGLAQL